jgi:hypothetical protein
VVDEVIVPSALLSSCVRPKCISWTERQSMKNELGQLYDFTTPELVRPRSGHGRRLSFPSHFARPQNVGEIGKGTYGTVYRACRRGEYAR